MAVVRWMMTRVGRRDLERGFRIPKEERATGARIPPSSAHPAHEATSQGQRGIIPSVMARLHGVDGGR